MQICRARTVLALLCTMLICQAAMAESGNQFSFSLTPAFVMPFSTGLGYFTSGGEAQFTAEYRLPVPDFLAVRADLSGSFLRPNRPISMRPSLGIRAAEQDPERETMLW